MMGDVVRNDTATLEQSYSNVKESQRILHPHS